MSLKPFPLAKQQELSKANLIDFARQIAPGSRQSFWHALDQLRRPLEVVGAVIFGFQYSKERVIFQPVRLVMAELLKGKSQLCARGGTEVYPSALEQPEFEGDNLPVIDGGFRKRRWRAVGCAQQSIFDQPVRAD